MQQQPQPQLQRYYAMPPLSPIPPSPLPSRSSSLRSDPRSPMLSPNEASILQRLGSGPAAATSSCSSSRLGSQRSLNNSCSQHSRPTSPGGRSTSPISGNLAYLASRRKSVAQNRRTSNFLELPGESSTPSLPFLGKSFSQPASKSSC